MNFPEMRRVLYHFCKREFLECVLQIQSSALADKFKQHYIPQEDKTEKLQIYRVQ